MAADDATREFRVHDAPGRGGRPAGPRVPGRIDTAPLPPERNPVGGWYGLKKGLRGRFGVYLPPLLEALGLAELTHEKRNNQMRAL